MEPDDVLSLRNLFTPPNSEGEKYSHPACGNALGIASTAQSAGARRARAGEILNTIAGD